MPVGPRPRGPRLTVGDIFQTHGEAFRRSHALSESQRKAMRDIEACRTPVLGGRVDVCACCGLERPVFYSCRNRHCPTCQSLAQARWIESRMARVLPCDYFHVVFTVPDELLAPLAMRNRAVFFDILFSAASQTLLALGKDEKRLGALMGLTAVLHTWTRDLRVHPNVHCIVTGGGLDPEGRWKASKRDYLFPVTVLSKLFCGKVLAALDEVYRQGGLTLRGVEGFGGDVPDDVVWRRLLKKSYQQKWVSYASTSCPTASSRCATTACWPPATSTPSWPRRATSSFVPCHRRQHLRPRCRARRPSRTIPLPGRSSSTVSPASTPPDAPTAVDPSSRARSSVLARRTPREAPQRTQYGHHPAAGPAREHCADPRATEADSPCRASSIPSRPYLDRAIAPPRRP